MERVKESQDATNEEVDQLNTLCGCGCVCMCVCVCVRCYPTVWTTVFLPVHKHASASVTQSWHRNHSRQELANLSPDIAGIHLPGQ